MRKESGKCMYEKADSKGFTLLEMLAALAIFSIIIVMMGNIYHQSSVAWDSGTRKAQGAIEARVILANIAAELSQAVALRSDALKNGIIEANHTGSSISFVTLRNRQDNQAGDFRDAYLVTYQMQGETLVRSEERIEKNALYDVSISYLPATFFMVATNVVGISFVTPGRRDSIGDPLMQNPEEALPRWVEITLKMGRLDEVSGVAAASAGPNGVFEVHGAPETDDIKIF